MCTFEGEDSLIVFKHIVKRHKNNPTFQVQCQFEGCASTYRKWNSYRQHLSRKHANAVPPEELEEETLQEPPEDVIVPQNVNPPQNENLQQDMNIEQGAGFIDVNGPPISAQKLLTWRVGKFLNLLREEGNTSQKAIDLVVEEVNDIMGVYLKKIHAELKLAKSNPEATSLSYVDIAKVFAEMKCQGLFEGVSSKFFQDKFLIENGRVTTKKVYIGTETFWTQTEPPKIIEKKVYAYILPLEASLQQLPSHPEVLLYPVVNTDDGTLKDLKDGSYYNTHFLFSSDPRALMIIFHFDDLQTSNVLGYKQHKFSMFYWTLGNVPPHLRSSLRAVNLYAVVRTKHLRKFGASKILSSFISDIKKLQSVGMNFTVTTGERNFRGSLLFVTADTPAAQPLGGFKEGVGSAHSPCRSCDATQETMQASFSEAAFTLRNKVTHNEQVQIVTDPTLPKGTAKHYRKQFGITGESAFASLKGFDVTKCFVHDFMHVMLEGVLPFEIQHFLKYVVRDRGLITLKRLNSLIKSYDYGHLQRDRPSDIDAAHLDNALRQNSLQGLALGHVLPFLLKPHMESDEGAVDRLHNLVILLQICNLSLSFELKEDDVALLEYMIVKHHTCFKIFYPGVNLPPKFHYMIHLPRQLMEFRPLRYQWCVRFEGTHWYFKRLMQIVLCYKIPPVSMCNRYSSRRTVQLLTFPGHFVSNFLDLGDKVSRGCVVSVEDHPHRDILKNALAVLTNNDFVMNAKFVVVKGTRVTANSAILIRSDSDEFPRFGRVIVIVVSGEEEVLVYRPLDTLCFEPNLNAYKVLDNSEIPRSICVRNLPFPHPLSIWRCAKEDYVVLFNAVPEFMG